MFLSARSVWLCVSNQVRNYLRDLHLFSVDEIKGTKKYVKIRMHKSLVDYGT